MQAENLGKHGPDFDNGTFYWCRLDIGADVGIIEWPKIKENVE